MSEEPSRAAETVSQAAGQIADRYRLLGRLGSGGMGDVYEGIHVSINRLVAVKVLRPEFGQDPRARQRLEREARIVGALECENVVSMLDFGWFDDGTPYLVMERLRGDDLKSVLKLASRLPVERAVSIALDVCRGLEAAHRAGLVHRDLKPANLFLCRRANGDEICKILDFGIARREGASTSFGASVVGTARYMAPEQIRDDGEVGAATDLYALGALLYECLSGVPVHEASSVEAMLFRVLHQEPTPLREIAPELPAELCAIIERALAKDPQTRFRSAVEFALALRPFARGGAPVAAPDITDSTLDASFEVAPRRTQKGQKKRRVPVFPALLAGATLLALSFGMGQLSGRRSSRADTSAAPPPLLCPASLAPPVTVSAPAPASTHVATPVVDILPPAPVSVPEVRRKVSHAPALAPARAPEAPRKPSPFVASNPYTGASVSIAGER